MHRSLIEAVVFNHEGMSIYHASVKTFSRSSSGKPSGGQSAVAAAAYRAGVFLFDERTQTAADYSGKSGVVTSFLTLPMAAPPWMSDRSLLWNMAEWSEKRCNSTVAREVEVALPVELPAGMREQVVRQMANFLSTRYGVVVDTSIHLPSRQGDERNHHAHMLMTTRAVTRDGFGVKTRILDDRKTGPEEVKVIRAQWADFVNTALAAMNIASRIDHRSHKDRGIDMPPQVHVGVSATNAERHGRKLESFPVLHPQTSKIINYPKIDHGVTRAEYNAEIINLQKYRHAETLPEKLARLDNQLIDLSADIETLKGQLNNDLLSEDLRSKIRAVIETAIAKIFFRQQETEYLKKVREAKALLRKLHELEAYYARLTAIQEETRKLYEAEQAKREADKKLHEAITRMSASLNGIPPFVINLEIPLSSAFNEASYTGILQRQTTADLLKAVMSPPTVAIKPALATVALRQDVLQVKELLSRGKTAPAGKGRVSAAQNFTRKSSRIV